MSSTRTGRVAALPSVTAVTAVTALAALAGCAAVALERAGEERSPARAPESAAAPAAAERGAEPAPVWVPDGWEAAREELLARVNRARRREGEGALARAAALDAAAQRHAEDMVEGRYFAHESRAGQTAQARVERAGYGELALLGETLGRESFGLGRPAPAEMVEGWLGSASHRGILLDPRFTETGIGIAVDRRRELPVYFWVELFATPRE